MEEIKIEGLKPFNTAKGQGLEVTFNGGRKATVAAWHQKEQGIINALGVGGTIQADVLQKGEYTNIENVQEDTANKVVTMPEPITNNEPVKKSNDLPMLSVRDNVIVAQVILKEANNNLCAHINSGIELEQEKYGKFLCDNVRELVGAYKVALSLLNE